MKIKKKKKKVRNVNINQNKVRWYKKAETIKIILGIIVAILQVIYYYNLIF